MYQLIAQGPDPKQRWRQWLHPGTVYCLGRDQAAELPVPWESFLSRRHVELTCGPDRVRLRRLSVATNPVYVEGKAVNECTLEPGEHFVVGGTRFSLIKLQSTAHSPSDQPVEEVAFTRQQLQQVRYEDADRRIEVLSRLPEVIAEASSEKELYGRLANVLLSGIGHADAVAVVSLDADGQMEVPLWERRRETEGEFRPSARLVTESLNRRQSLLHVWDSSDAVRAEYTVSADFDWAYCTPVGTRGTGKWALYVAGRLLRSGTLGSTDALPVPRLQADVKFTELVADVIDSAQRLSDLEGNLSVLRQFLSPPIVATLEQSSEGRVLDAALLAPKECDVTVLFCDLRGFSQKAEESADDLGGLLERVSAALEIMTQHILGCGGVTGDFLGDASLGFWGWPFASEEAPLNACRAALAIRRAFVAAAAQDDHPLARFEVGIGIAHGRAMAGKIGTRDRVTVTVLGPVVNLASRLESMTRQLHVPIALDEATADIVRQRLSESEGRTRRLGRVLPYGLETPLMISELLPPAAEFPELTDEHIRLYEQGVEHFLVGRWDQAYRCLHAMPPSDRAQDFLAVRIAQHNRTPPKDWDGVVRLPSK